MRPLDGIRVLDLSRVFAGPVAGRVLSDLGAEVVKVEPPEGDVTRRWGRKTGGISTYFLQQNCGKENICVDLRAEGGPPLIAELARVADVVIENFRPGVLARFGLDWASLSADHPELVMLSISGFGQDGPESQRAAYAGVIHAETGLVDQESPGWPVDLSFSAADVLSGMHGVIAILAALRMRDATGVGQHIDLAMTDAMLFSNDKIIDSLDGRRGERMNGEIWQTAAGKMTLVGGLRWIWHQLSNVHGLVDPTPSDADLETKLESRRRIVTDFLCSLPDREAVIRALDDANLAWGELRELGSVLESPTTAHRRTVAEVDDREGSRRRVIRSPYRFSATDTTDVGIPAHRGEHNEPVLTRWLGIDAPSVVRLIDDGVLVADEWAERAGAPGGQRGAR
jgi:crotonobetainyl-CoA:carnitine CoA-transferase CaiB-like acyl-CoA transferase